MPEENHIRYMQNCLQLALKGLGTVAPNPMVGAVVVHENRIIGEGFHAKFGDQHAEVKAINSVDDQSLLKSSTLYVNLEPCSHHGKTPPCNELIISKQITEVVIAHADPYPEVSGKGITSLKSAGVNVIEGICETEARFLNRRFIRFYSEKRPYIILKWAQTADGIMGLKEVNKKDRLIISNSKSQLLVHQWRSEEQAILAGKNTILFDDPMLNVRLVKGNNPQPIIFAGKHEIPTHLKIHQQSPVFISDKSNALKLLTEYCIQNKILSVLVEGGAEILNLFIHNHFWDEARVITNTSMKIGSGLKSPQLNIKESDSFFIGEDQINIYYNKAI